MALLFELVDETLMRIQETGSLSRVKTEVDPPLHPCG